jgi:DUF4097 and DUF4098 domain-containing protein YvlB
VSIFDQTYAGIRSVSIEQRGSGDVLINAGDSDQVRCTVDEWDAADPTAHRIEQRHDRLVITAPESWGGGSNSDVILEVPAGLDVSVATQSGDIVINADVASGRLTAGSGDIAVGAAATLSAKAGSGDVSVGRVTEAVELTTGSGDITIREASGPVSAKSGSGDLRLDRLRAASVNGSTGSGDISVPSTTGSVDLRSASGSIEVGVAEGMPAWLDLNTVTGDIRIDLDPSQRPEEGKPFVTIRCRTASGEIDISRARD